MLIANTIYDVETVSQGEIRQEVWRTITAYMDEKANRRINEKNKVKLIYQPLG